MRLFDFSELNVAPPEISETALQPAPEPLEQIEPAGKEIPMKSADEIFAQFGFNDREFLWRTAQQEVRDPEVREALRQAEVDDANERYLGTTANCYYFSFGWPPEDILGWPERPQPGQLALSKTGKGSFDPFIFDEALRSGTPEELKNYIIRLCREDCEVYGKELVEVDADYQPKLGERMVVLCSRQPQGFLGELFGGRADYHFLLRGQYGSYLHKPGLDPVTDLDDKGHIIEDPAECRIDYPNLLGYYVLRDKEV